MPYLSYLYKKGFIFSTFFLYFFLYNQNFLLSNKQQLLFFIVWCTKKMKNIFLLWQFLKNALQVIYGFFFEKISTFL